MHTTEPKTPNKRRTWLILFSLLVIVVIGVLGYLYYSEHYPSTNDSYVQAHVVNMAPQVSGPVIKINVKNHELVQKDQVLYIIDPAPYEYSLMSAEAQLKLAEETGKRQFPLIKTGKIAPSRGDSIKSQIQQAQYDLDHTVVRAPATGVLANFTVRIGDTVSKGVELFNLVEQNNAWVDANYKETQLTRIKVGQSAKIFVDMYPDYTFKGRVESISPGTGSIFSLLPPENATGNWVKVTQRVPVKVVITNPNPRYPLIAGSSATVRINTTK